MEKTIKKISLAIFVLFIMAFIPTFAAAGTIEGTIQGFKCVTEGKTCPVGMEDPMAAVERVFVVLTSGKDYYFVPNMDRAVMARHINDRVRVSGNVHPNFPSIEANTLEVFSRGAWRTTWTFSWQKRIEDDLKNIMVY